MRPTTTRRAHRLTGLALFCAGFAAGPVDAQTLPPSLIVVLVVDQMRADTIERYSDQWTSGLRRLLDEGAVFREAQHSYFGTLTCAGHATIATGTVPRTHGMILDGWWDPMAGQRVRCTADDTVEIVAYGPGARERHGPAHMLVPTLADELRLQNDPPAQVAAFAVKARAAVPLAGRRGDAVAWFDAGNVWTTSTAFTDAPLPFIANYIRAQPVEDALGLVWTPLHGSSATTSPKGGDFAHTLAAEPGREFYNAWRRSPWADQYVTGLAIASVDALALGAGSGTDYLAVGFSAPDYVGHDFGPHSAEVQDIYLRLDRAIGRLLDHLDRNVGHDRYVVALSADHGLGPTPEHATEMGLDAGRIDRREVIDHVNAVLEPFFGPGKHAVGMTHIEFYFALGVYDRLLASPEALSAVLEALEQYPGIHRVYRGEELETGPFGDRVTQQVARSYYPERSGDLVIIPKPYWYTWVRAADHGTGYDYDARVPLVIAGPGIIPGHYSTAAAPEDLAPTLAFLAGVTLARPDGLVLTDALSDRNRP